MFVSRCCSSPGPQIEWLCCVLKVYCISLSLKTCHHHSCSRGVEVSPYVLKRLCLHEDSSEYGNIEFCAWTQKNSIKSLGSGFELKKLNEIIRFCIWTQESPMKSLSSNFKLKRTQSNHVFGAIKRSGTHLLERIAHGQAMSPFACDAILLRR